MNGYILRESHLNPPFHRLYFSLTFTVFARQWDKVELDDSSKEKTTRENDVEDNGQRCSRTSVAPLLVWWAGASSVRHLRGYKRRDGEKLSPRDRLIQEGIVWDGKKKATNSYTTWVCCVSESSPGLLNSVAKIRAG